MKILGWHRPQWETGMDDNIWWGFITCMIHGWPGMKECFRSDMKSEDLLGSWTWLGLLDTRMRMDGNHVMWICDRSSWWEYLLVEYKKMSQVIGTLSYILCRGFTLRRRIVLNIFATSIFHCYSFCSLRWGMCSRKELRMNQWTEWNHWSMGYSDYSL